VDPKLPRHLAVIMDGNGRWARLRGRPRVFGHRQGTEATRETVRYCSDAGIPYLTLYTFSSENWKRPRKEVDFLMNLMAEMVDREIPEMMERNVRMKVLGDLERLPEKGRRKLEEGMERTAGNTGMQLTLAISYGGRMEVVHACRQLAEAVKAGRIDVASIDEAAIAGALYLPDLPEVDLMIRTGGEQRTSNYLIWQAAYAELWFTEALWPDFGDAELAKAFEWFAGRERRFGGVLGAPAEGDDE